MAEPYGYDLGDPAVLQIPPHLIEQFPANIVRDIGALPVAEEDGVVVFAVEDSLAPESLDKLRFVCNGKVKLARATASAIELSFRRHYGKPFRSEL